MHSHERTMLSRLGFADPDKRETLHDLACRYVAQPEVAKTLPLVYRGDNLVFKGSVLEQPIHKGKGQYSTTIGFIDVLYITEQELYVVLEIKIKYVPVGDLLRQLNLYRDYFIIMAGGQCPHLCAVVNYDVTDDYVQTLEKSGVQLVRLGDGFRRYVEEAKQAPPSTKVVAI